MAQQTINIGAAPNDGTGTPLRTSFDYTNQNFTELYTALGGGVGLPGATTQVIFNDGGTNLAGDAGLTYNKTTDALTVVGALSGSKLTVTGGTIPANGVYLPAANTLEFAANSLAQYRIAPLGVFSWYNGAGGTRMTLNSNGLGVGVTPNAWYSGWSVIQFQNGTAVGNPLNGEGAFLSANIFRNASNTDTYISTGFATRYRQQLGSHEFFSALSGTGGTTAAPFLNQTMTLDVNGNLMVGVASANANGGVLQLKSGITFPATQVAATDVNTLDDYEEGTWTGTLKGSITDPTVAVTSTGRYTKIGRQVLIDITFTNISNVGASGDITVTGLPFACSNNANAVGATSFNGIATFTGSPISFVAVNTTTLLFAGNVSGLPNVNATHNPGTGRYFNASISYSV
jgi:hypothetical protein